MTALEVERARRRDVEARIRRGQAGNQTCPACHSVHVYVSRDRHGDDHSGCEECGWDDEMPAPDPVDSTGRRCEDCDHPIDEVWTSGPRAGRSVWPLPIVVCDPCADAREEARGMATQEVAR